MQVDCSQKNSFKNLKITALQLAKCKFVLVLNNFFLFRVFKRG